MSRIVRLTLAGAALALGALAMAVLTLVYLGILAFHVGLVDGLAWVALVGGLVLAACCGLQAWAWAREATDLTRASWWAHVLAYPAVLTAVIGFAGMCGTSVPGSPLFWMTLAGAVLALLAHGVGAVQYLRPDGPPGTLRAHLRRWVQRTNEREDAAVAAQTEETP